MTETSKTAETAAAEAKARAAYLVQRDGRTRFSFGKVWVANVQAGKVTDKDKLIAHGIKLKAGTQRELSKLKFETVLARVQKALSAGGGATAA